LNEERTTLLMQAYQLQQALGQLQQRLVVFFVVFDDNNNNNSTFTALRCLRIVFLSVGNDVIEMYPLYWWHSMQLIHVCRF